MKQLLGTVFVALLGFVFWHLAPLMAPGELNGIADYFARYSVRDNHVANVVTAIVVNYRGFDTAGEVLVLFASVAGVGFILRRNQGVILSQPRSSGELVATASRGLIAPVIVFGAYIFIHGHLTPGGGFQGGVVIASGVLLLMMADRDRSLPHGFMLWLESLSGFSIVLVGAVGLVAGGSFLANRVMSTGGELVPLGEWNRLFSAGLIPVLYVLVGLKVGAELSALLDAMLHAGVPEEE